MVGGLIGNFLLFSAALIQQGQLLSSGRLFGHLRYYQAKKLLQQANLSQISLGKTWLKFPKQKLTFHGTEAAPLRKYILQKSHK